MKLGIDPGLKGALVLIDDGKVVASYDMPTRPKITKGKNEVCPSSLAEILTEIKAISPQHLFATLELVNAMPTGAGRMPAASAFNFGEGFGIIRACLECHHIAYQMVTPAKWKKAAGLTGKHKDFSRTLANQLYPDYDIGAKYRGRADALCIAHFCG